VTTSAYTTPDLEMSYLIQRLMKPLRAPGKLGALARDNPFAFGAGRKNGGLSDEAMDLLRDVFSFDYMGAGEFEFGAVPRALGKLAEAARHDDLAEFELEVALSDVEKPYDAKRLPPDDATGVVYVLCPGAWADEVTRRIRFYAAHQYPRDEHRYQLKEPTSLNRALLPVNEWDERRCGWLELDNGYAFFTDLDMFVKTCELFGVATDEWDASEEARLRLSREQAAAGDIIYDELPAPE
jgi:hypothetical protein